MTIYTIDHDSIYLGSTSKQKVDFYQIILSGITEEMIKLNKVEDRHGLLVGMLHAGHCPIAVEYFEVKAYLQKKYNEFMGQFGKYATSCRYKDKNMLVWDASKAYAIDQTLEDKGWQFN